MMSNPFAGLAGLMIGMSVFFIIMVLGCLFLMGMFHIGICRIYTGLVDSKTKIKCFVPILQSFVSYNANPTKPAKLYAVMQVAIAGLTLLMSLITILFGKLLPFLVTLLIPICSILLVIASIACAIAGIIRIYNILVDCGNQTGLAILFTIISIISFILIAFIYPGKVDLSDGSNQSEDTYISF